MCKKPVFSDNKLSEASGGEINSSEQNDLEEGRDGDEELENGVIDAVPVDENLFTGEDLDELEEELNTLDLEEWIKKLIGIKVHVIKCKLTTLFLLLE